MSHSSKGLSEPEIEFEDGTVTLRWTAGAESAVALTLFVRKAVITCATLEPGRKTPAPVIIDMNDGAAAAVQVCEFLEASEKALS